MSGGGASGVMVVERPGLAKAMFLCSCMLLLDLSDDIPAVYVAFITLEEWQAAREEPSVRWVYFVLYCPSPSLMMAGR